MKSAGKFPAFLAIALLFTGCNKGGYPAIKNDATLRGDCVRLLEQFPQGEIPKDKWPKSIAALKPLQVQREAGSIRIWTHQQRGQYANGYYVFADAQLSPPGRGVWIKRTPFTGIYRFEMPW